MHYLDNAATTRVADAVADTADAVLRAHYANPSSLYAPGAQSEFVLSGARETVAASLGAQPGRSCSRPAAPRAITLLFWAR